MICRTFLLAVALAGPALADAPGAVARLDLAARLHARGIATGDALAVATAFRLARGVTLRPADWAHRTENATDDDAALAPPLRPLPDQPETADAARIGASVLALVTGQGADAALIMAEGDDDLTELVEDAAAETARGRIGSANHAEAVLPPGKKDIWEIPFAGMERAEVAVFGDGSGGLGWMVADAAGLPVCIAHHATDPLYCSFTPAANGFYTVTVLGTVLGTVPDRSSGDIRYLIVTN